MDRSGPAISTIDAYIATCPEEVREQLEELRATIRAAAPDAVEIISYQMPAFAQNGNLVYFAASRNHIGLYPTSSGVAAFQDELAPYSSSRGTIRFPLGQPLPLDLIRRIVEFRVAENLSRTRTKTRARKS